MRLEKKSRGNWGRNRSWGTEGGRSGQKLENELLKLNRRQKKEGRKKYRPEAESMSPWPDSERDTHDNGNLDCLLSYDTPHAEYLIWPGEYFESKLETIRIGLGELVSLMVTQPAARSSHLPRPVSTVPKVKAHRNRSGS